jgi:hypothetical protein
MLLALVSSAILLVGCGGSPKHRAKTAAEPPQVVTVQGSNEPSETLAHAQDRRQSRPQRDIKAKP